MEKAEKSELHIVDDKPEGIYGFIEKNRKSLVRSGAAALVLLAGLIAALLARDAMQKDATAKLDILAERYEKLESFLTGGFDEAGPEDGGVESLLADLRALGKGASGYPAARALFMAADIHYERGEWAEARDAWLEAASNGKAAHLAPVSLFNAAVADEEAGETDAALENYKKALGFTDFSSAARAQFAVGRLEEKRGDNEAALAAYRAVIEKWPSYTDWANLAHSRILAIELAAAAE